MKRTIATLIVVLALVGLAVVADRQGWLAPVFEASLAAQARGQKPAAPPAAKPPQSPEQEPVFDGNVANLVWGGRLESITGEPKLARARVILVDPHPGSHDYGT